MYRLPFLCVVILFWAHLFLIHESQALSYEERYLLKRRLKTDPDGGPATAPGFDGTGDSTFSDNYYEEMANLPLEDPFASEWVNIGPDSAGGPPFYNNAGKTTHFAQDQYDRNRVYVAFIEGGLWVTENFFDEYPTWRSLTDQLESLSARAIALSTVFPGVIYYVTGDANRGLVSYLYISSDYGATWSDKIDYSKVLFYGPSYGASKIRTIAYPQRGVEPLLILAEPNIPWDKTLEGYGIVFSPDGGKTFSEAYKGGRVSDIAQNRNEIIGYDHQHHKFIRSFNYGETFQEDTQTNFGALVATYLINGSAADAGPTVFGSSYTGGGLFAMVVNNRDQSLLDIFRSDDFGYTWRGKLNGVGVNAKGRPTNPVGNWKTLNFLCDPNGEKGTGLGSFLVDPEDENVMYVFGQLVSGKTNDGGQTWSIIADWTGPRKPEHGLPFIHADISTSTAFRSNPIDPGTFNTKKLIVVGNDGGFTTSADGGVTWDNTRNTGLATHLVYTIDGAWYIPGIYMIGMQDDDTRQRVSSSSTQWDILLFTGDGMGNAYSQAFPRFQVISQYHTSIFCVPFGGTFDFKDWLKCRSGIPVKDDQFYTALARPSAKVDPTGTVFYTRNNATIFKSALNTTDGGTLLWNAIGQVGMNGMDYWPFEGGLNTIGLSPYDDSKVIVIKAFSNRFAFTLNGGASWIARELDGVVPGGFSSATSPLFDYQDNMYIASQSWWTSGQPRVIKSSKSSDWTQWVRADNGLPDVPVTKIAFDLYQYYMYAATWLGMFYSPDMGNTWLPLGRNLPKVVIKDFYVGDTSIAIATWGRGVWELPLPLLFSVGSTHDDLGNLDGSIGALGLVYLPEVQSALVSGLDRHTPDTCHDACYDQISNDHFFFNLYMENGLAQCTCVTDFQGDYREVRGATTFIKCMTESSVAMKMQIHARRVMLGKIFKVTIMLKSWNKAVRIEDLGLTLPLPAGVSYVKSSVFPSKASKKMSKMPNPSISDDGLLTWSNFDLGVGKNRKFQIYLRVDQDALQLNPSKQLSFAPMIFQIDPVDDSTACEISLDAVTVTIKH